MPFPRKMTDEQVRAMRRLLYLKTKGLALLTLNDVAQAFGVSKETVRRVKRWEVYKRAGMDATNC